MCRMAGCDVSEASGYGILIVVMVMLTVVVAIVFCYSR